MVSKLVSRCTYANVTATVALFIALASGVAVGATAIVKSSKDVAKQSIANSDVKRETLKSNRLRNGKAVSEADVIPNSLGGTAIDEASLGHVPNAAHADSATIAGNAADASALGGLASDQFARTSPIQAGGPAAGDALTQAVLLSLPELGRRCEPTATRTSILQIRVVNTNAAGGREYIVTSGIAYANSLDPRARAITPADPAGRESR